MQDIRPFQPAKLLRYVSLALGAALMLALFTTWAETGQLLAGDDWNRAFFERFVQLGFLGLIVAAQTAGLLIGIVTGIVLAFAAVLLYESDMASQYWLGRFFLTSLKMIIVPLIVFAMISGITSVGDVRKLGRMGGRTVLYYFATTTLAVILGSILVNLFQPGVGVVVGDPDVPAAIAAKSAMGLSDIVMGCVSDNVVGSMAELQMLPLIIFSLVFGAVLTTLGEQGKPMIAACDAGNAAMMKIVHLIMILAPVGVYGLIAGRFGLATVEPVFAKANVGLLYEAASTHGLFFLGGGWEPVLANVGTAALWGELQKVLGYSATVVTGLGIHAIVVIPLILWFTTGRSPLRYARGLAKALMTAFSTASSAATMPLTLEAVETQNGVDRRASQFVIPLGATVNMDGTALYEAVAVIFIAQAFGIELSFGQQVVIVITATLAAIGAAGIPQAGLVTMVIVLQAVGLPLSGIELILAVDWLLDRFRTTVNVWGDAVGAAVIERHGLDPLPPPEGGAVAQTNVT